MRLTPYLLVVYAILLVSGRAQTSTPKVSLGDIIRHTGNDQLRIFYVHGMAADGPGDFDSWSFRRSICRSFKGCYSTRNCPSAKQRCSSTAGDMESTEPANEGPYASATPPNLFYLGYPVWGSDSSTPEADWKAAAPFVIHWQLDTNSGHVIHVDEINWWPLVFALKCRQMVKEDAAAVGPAHKFIDICSGKPTKGNPQGSYPWITVADAEKLKQLPNQGAAVNRYLKNYILDWGFTDAVLSVGPLRSLILDGIRQLVLKSVAMRPDTTQGTSSVPPADQEYVIVSHSLGSYLMFAALDDNPPGLQTDSSRANAIQYDAILSRTSSVYFFANQLRLLELANLDSSSEKNMTSHLEHWGKVRTDYLKSHAAVAQQYPPRPQITAWNDPSDLLTWTVPDIKNVDVTNVPVHNAIHWLWLLEGPTSAHDGYAHNSSVISEMLKTANGTAPQ
jgi:hypothetical protein